LRPACGGTGAHPAGTVVSLMAVRPTTAQVLSLAPDHAAATAATAAADPAAWSAAGCDDTAVWGQYIAAAGEPYEVAVELVSPAFRCSCPSRKVPCKHCLALLLLHADQRIAPARRLGFVEAWLQQRAASAAGETAAPQPDLAGDGDEAVAAVADPVGARSTPRLATADDQRDARRTERAERMRAGLVEFDRWLADRVRVGLSAAEFADLGTWHQVAARLVDAQCGGLANRVKRVAARVGQHGRWHEDVLEEMAVLHLMVQGALRTSTLPDDLVDGVHAATGLVVAKNDVLAGVPSTARWQVVGESRVREERITVLRTWLHARDEPVVGVPWTPTWAMVLSFGVLGNDIVSDHTVGTEFDADVHWYPGAVPLRALVGHVHSDRVAAGGAPRSQTVSAAVSATGWLLAREPWLERSPVCLMVVPIPVGDGRWVLADDSGAVPIVPGFWRLAELVALSGGRPVTVMGELAGDGFTPLSMWSGAGRSVKSVVLL